MRKGVKRIVVALAAVGLAATIVIGIPGNAFASNGGSERFLLVFSSQHGPGAIIANGAFTAGGKEYQGSNVDLAVFPSGAFNINHRGGHVKSHFNPTTCEGTFTGIKLPFTLSNGYGSYKGISGSGLADLHAKFTTGRKQNGTCSNRITAYAEIINASGQVSFK
jgi:hypothetical protein